VIGVKEEDTNKDESNDDKDQKSDCSKEQIFLTSRTNSIVICNKRVTYYILLPLKKLYHFFGIKFKYKILGNLLEHPNIT